MEAVLKNRRHSDPPVRQKPQPVAAKDRCGGQKGQDQDIGPCGLPETCEVGDEHRHGDAVDHADVHHLPVPLDGHGDDNGQAEQDKQQDPAV